MRFIPAGGEHRTRGTLLIDVQQIINELEEQKSAIDSAIAALRGIPGPSMPAAKRAAQPAAPGRRRRISAEGRRRIAEAQRRRWAVQRGGETAPAAKKSSGRKRRAKKTRAARKTAVAKNVSAVSKGRKRGRKRAMKKAAAVAPVATA